MATHTIYTHPNLPPAAVKVGWGWPAFFFSGIWCLVKGLYKHFFIVLAVMFGGVFIGAFVFQDREAVGWVRDILGLIVCLYLGANGNELRGQDLLNKGYVAFKNVDANTPEDALKYAPSITPNHAPTSNNINVQDKYNQIEKLKALKDAGALTDDEFTAEKNKMLGQ